MQKSVKFPSQVEEDKDIETLVIMMEWKEIKRHDTVQQRKEQRNQGNKALELVNIDKVLSSGQPI